MENKNEDTNGIEQENFAPEYRDRLRTWLIKMINSGKIPGLFWENEEKTIFRMPWKHAGRQDYNLEEDSLIFMAWAKHSGRYRQGIDKPEPIVWKTRLRCALNKMPDIRELPDRSRLDISEPYRVYHLLPPVHKASQIRRRLYKRSQSQETDHTRSYSDHTQHLSLLNPTNCDADTWKENSTGTRRSNSMETAQSSVSSQITPPISTAPPAYWFTPPVDIPLKNTAALPAGLQLPQTTPFSMDAINPLWKQLAQTRYPLVPSLHAPFAPLSTASMSSIFSNTQASLAALKQFGLSSPPPVVDQAKQFTEIAVTAEQHYRDQLATLTRKLDEGSKYNFADEKILCQRLANMEKISSQDYAHIRRNSAELQIKVTETDTNTRNAQALMDTSPNKYLSKLNPLGIQFFEFQKKIENLEKDLAESRTAHAREREARQKIEAECQKIKIILEHSETGFQHREVFCQQEEASVWRKFNNAHNEKVLKYDKHPLLEEKIAPRARRVSEKGVAIRSLLRVPSPEHITLPSTYVSMRKSSVQAANESIVKQEKNSETYHRKRSSLPLDLTVYSPPKQQRLSGDEDNDVPSFANTSSLSPYSASSSFVTSLSPSLTSCDEKRVIASPVSASSESSGSSSPQISSDYQRRSLSPPQRTNALLQAHQHQGTIKVT